MVGPTGSPARSATTHGSSAVPGGAWRTTSRTRTRFRAHVTSTAASGVSPNLFEDISDFLHERVAREAHHAGCRVDVRGDFPQEVRRSVSRLRTRQPNVPARIAGGDARLDRLKYRHRSDGETKRDEVHSPVERRASALLDSYQVARFQLDQRPVQRERRQGPTEERLGRGPIVCEVIERTSSVWMYAARRVVAQRHEAGSTIHVQHDHLADPPPSHSLVCKFDGRVAMSLAERDADMAGIDV